MPPNESSSASPSVGAPKNFVVVSGGGILPSFLKTFVGPSDPDYAVLTAPDFVPFRNRRTEEVLSFKSTVESNGVKHEVTLTATPPPFGRRPNYRPMANAIAKADGVIILQKLAYSAEFSVNLVNKHSTTKKPVTFIYGSEASYSDNEKNKEKCKTYCTANNVPFFVMNLEEIDPALAQTVAAELVKQSLQAESNPVVQEVEMAEPPFKKLSVKKAAPPSAEVVSLVV